MRQFERKIWQRIGKWFIATILVSLTTLILALPTIFVAPDTIQWIRMAQLDIIWILSLVFILALDLTYLIVLIHHRGMKKIKPVPAEPRAKNSPSGSKERD